ncbi:MAG TPA: inositol monophosphatase family protein [Kofleriaceae bacterium]|nr:inositol monophosphatase family protein [Kofleriaceae bacterium]
MLDRPWLQRAFDVARAAAEAGGSIALGHYRAGVAVERKGDGSPVTIADREAEAAIVAVIRDAFPDHGILGEEGGELATGSARWIIDPIDGTHGFANGGLFWGPLVALEAGGEIVAGALALPVLGELYVAAKGLGCWRDRERVTLSTTSRWEDATVSFGQLRRIATRIGWDRLQRIIDTAGSARSYGDVGAAVMLLSGRAEVWLEAGVAPWDIAPQQILVTEAGGRFVDLSTEKSALLAANAPLFEHVRALCGA